MYVMNIIEKIHSGIVFLDGAMGSVLQKGFLKSGEKPENLNITKPEVIKNIHKEYLKSGADIILTNTFGANPLKFENFEELVREGIKIAKEAILEFGEKDKFVALDIGPTGRLLKPLGDLDFEDAVEVFKKVVLAAEGSGADLIMLETLNDSYETKAAVIAAKEASSLPIFVSNVYDESQKLMTGANPYAMVSMLEGLGVDAIGLNCSLGPVQMKKIVPLLYECASVPIIVSPNAGLPRLENGETVYDITADEFAAHLKDIVNSGARIVGGCCGTTPEYIKKTVSAVKGLEPLPIIKKDITCVSSYTHAVNFDNLPIIIGERINPTGKARFKQALKENDTDYILGEGISQAENGAHILDVNVGLPEIDEKAVLKNVVYELQAVTDLPLQIDTSDFDAMENAMRIYNGKPLVNSVNGKEESMKRVFPLVRKYGGCVIALTLDENGIPETADGRIEIAKKIISRAQEYGIDKKDIIIDPLVLTISADESAAMTTLEAVKRLSEEGFKTSLGVSNVSFGLPGRPQINSAFFTMALFSGLSAAIINPLSFEMMSSYYSFLALSKKDVNCEKYIKFASSVVKETTLKVSESKENENKTESDLIYAITKGLKEKAASAASALLKDIPPLKIINDHIIYALNIMGEGFEKKKVFLPQLLMSAEASKSAFEVIKSSMPQGTSKDEKSFTIVIATVKGDIHDIGKNIVKVLLENYGFDVCDLGKDVPPEEVVLAVKKHNAPLVGLSALMTTTVPSMAETIRLLKKECPGVKTVVGGAVLTAEYAKMIEADHYAKDAMEAVRYAEKLKRK